MAQSISIRETRNNLAELVDRVALAGDEFVVTKFGKPKAMLVPINEASQLGEGILDEVFGAWKNRKDIPDSGVWVRKLRDRISLRVKDE